MSGKRNAARKAAEEVCRRGYEVIGVVPAPPSRLSLKSW